MVSPSPSCSFFENINEKDSWAAILTFSVMAEQGEVVQELNNYLGNRGSRVGVGKAA